MISSKDRCRLRELAKKQLEYANSPETEKILSKWKVLAESKLYEPIVRMAFPAFKDEIIFPKLQCEGEFARELEQELLVTMAGRELFDDDSVVPDYYQFIHRANFNVFGLKPAKRYSETEPGKKVAYHIEPIITDLKNDLHLFTKHGKHSVDREKADAKIDAVSGLIGDILPVRVSMAGLDGCVTSHLVMLMGMENMYTAMLDYPDEFHRVMELACENYEDFYDWLAREKLLYPTNARQPVAMDTYAYTNKLPDEPLSTHDVWGHINNQESSAISPGMFGEFVFPYMKRVASNFGLVSCGCCEPVHPVWDKYLSTIPNLQRISISAWCDENYMGPRLRGSGKVYHRKPTAVFLMSEGPLDENAVRDYFTKTALAASGCILEITQREVLTIHGNVEKVRRYISLIKETVSRHWKP